MFTSELIDGSDLTIVRGRIDAGLADAMSQEYQERLTQEGRISSLDASPEVLQTPHLACDFVRDPNGPTSRVLGELGGYQAPTMYIYELSTSWCTPGFSLR